MCAKSLQSYSTLCYSMDCSPPGSSILGVLQAKLLEWVAMPSRSSSQCRDQTHVPWSSCIAGELFTAEPLGKSLWMWELDIKEGWMLKNWCFWTVLPEKTLESPLDYKEIKSVNPKGNQSWIFNGRSIAEAEEPILGHLIQALTHWKRPWWWKILKAKGEGGGRGSDG